MKHKVRLTVIDKKLYPELQEKYCANPCSGACPCCNVGDVFEFYRDDERDDFWHMGINTLVKTTANPDSVAGGPKMPHCSELWDAISRYIYTGLQGGSIRKGWMVGRGILRRSKRCLMMNCVRNTFPKPGIKSNILRNVGTRISSDHFM